MKISYFFSIYFLLILNSFYSILFLTCSEGIIIEILFFIMILNIVYLLGYIFVFTLNFIVYFYFYLTVIFIWHIAPLSCLLKNIQYNIIILHLHTHLYHTHKYSLLHFTILTFHRFNTISVNLGGPWPHPREIPRKNPYSPPNIRRSLSGGYPVPVPLGVRYRTLSTGTDTHR